MRNLLKFEVCRPTEIDIRSVDSDQSSVFVKSRETTRKKSGIDFENYGGRDVIRLFVYCMVLEEILAEQQPLKNIMDYGIPFAAAAGNASVRGHVVGNLLGFAATGSGFLALDSFRLSYRFGKHHPQNISADNRDNFDMNMIEQMNNLLSDVKSKNTSRLMSSSSSLGLELLKDIETIQADIYHKPAKDDDSIYQQNYLHVLVKKDSAALSHAVKVCISVFYVQDKKSVELPFSYIESYNGQDENGHFCDGYYLLPDKNGDFPDAYFEGGILLADVDNAYAYPLKDDVTTAHVVVLLTNPPLA